MNDISSRGAATINEELFITPKSHSERMPLEKNTFSVFFRKKLKALSKKEGYSVSKKDIAEKLGISYELFRKIVNREKPASKRDCIIAVCIVLGLQAADTNDALYYNYMEELDEKNKRDAVILGALAARDEPSKTIADINISLIRNGLPQLDIISHKSTNAPPVRTYPFKLARKHFQCTVSGVGRFDRPDYFLDLLYDPDCFYTMRTCMEFDDNGRQFEICIRYDEASAPYTDDIFQSAVRRRIFPVRKKYIVYSYPYTDQASELSEYDDPGDTGRFRDCFAEICKTEAAEKRRLYDILNDTRNYGKRISAKVIDNELHVFCEEYNCDIPELSEYYLMDHCKGIYTLYVLKSSCFMELYLSGEKYEKIYGRQRLEISKRSSDTDGYGYEDTGDIVKEQYSSVADIEASAYEAKDVGIYESYSESAVTELRVRAFRKMKARTAALIKKLKAGTAHICNREALDSEAEDTILTFFNAEKGFECTPGSSTKIPPEQKVTFTLSDGRHADLSANDLTYAYELGLQTIDEAGAFLLEHGSLDIKKIL